MDEQLHHDVAVFFFKNNLKNLLNVPIDIQNISYMIKNI